MLIGYARVSTNEQNLDLQKQALLKAGCEKIFEDQGLSGTKINRPALIEAIKLIQKGDVLVVWKLDRLGRSLSHLVTTIEDFSKKGIQFKSLTENIDTTTSSGSLVFGIMAVLAQFERSLIIERTNAGLASARKRGIILGRRKSITGDKSEIIEKLVQEGYSRNYIAKFVNVSRYTLYKHLKEANFNYSIT